ncbi:NADH-quinone oxidoreductase subunit J [Microbacterium sp. SCN 69-37]|uniref:NADH-quinone oxidoreductase subunit J n=1 Tax=Microbacterium sp. SCN 69-37 TaxID=1660115 RepID=UPI00086C104B|nr:NADH-quinone oxidoreductase subunit J [Microbacterium sp. SCN 69-37]ODT25887.1 MAG: NADH:ubiquinone oxidoreductase subunit J [Microbacterium sp. SCN 69-37]
MIASVLFWISALVAVVAGALVFKVDSMARATYALALSFIAVGVAVLTMRQDFVGIIVILMMVMEMAIMAVFMISYMGMNPALMPMDMTHAKRPAAAIATIVFVGLGAAVLLIPWPVIDPQPVEGLTEQLGEAMMGSKMLVMLTVSPVLFATIVASVVLASPRGRYDRYGDRLRGPAHDPEPGGLGR